MPLIEADGILVVTSAIESATGKTLTSEDSKFVQGLLTGLATWITVNATVAVTGEVTSGAGSGGTVAGTGVIS